MPIDAFNTPDMSASSMSERLTGPMIERAVLPAHERAAAEAQFDLNDDDDRLTYLTNIATERAIEHSDTQPRPEMAEAMEFDLAGIEQATKNVCITRDSFVLAA